VQAAESSRCARALIGDMKAAATQKLSLLAACSTLVCTLIACAPTSRPTLFVPPSAAAYPTLEGPVAPAPDPIISPSATPAVVPTLVQPSPTPPCADGLSYIRDLTIPDGTNVAPGQTVDKQWLVKNSGTCNWDVRYRLKLIGGDAMGAAPIQALYPARAGTEIALRIVFTAPSATGLYESQWKAIAPDGKPFGDFFSVSITVAP
jgi:hypothetical protein